MGLQSSLSGHSSLFEYKNSAQVPLSHSQMPAQSTLLLIFGNEKLEALFERQNRGRKLLCCPECGLTFSTLGGL